MLRAFVLLVGVLALTEQAPVNLGMLRATRSSQGDLELGGELKGLPAGSTRYMRYEDLLRLPQETYTVRDDTNFNGPVEIQGVSLHEIARLFGDAPDDAMIVAICYDKYRTNYPREYMAAHHPLLVLRINGQTRERWPKSENGGPLGPYLISHPLFKPAFKVLSHEDEPQIPFGVVRLELRRESVVFGAIRAPGRWTANSSVEQGYAIARQDCFRCHNMGAEGGTMAKRSWPLLAADASRDGARFQRMIHDPASVVPEATMPAHKDYDQETLNALTAYFKTFARAGAKR